MTDSVFIEGLKKGDEEIFRKFIDQHQSHLLRLCNGFLHNREDSRDLVQEVFIEVFRSIHSFRGDSSLSTWLYRIAVNKSLNFVRSNKKLLKNFSVHLSKNKKSGTDITDESQNSDRNIEQLERAKHIRKIINILPKNQRIAFILNKYEDFSYQDISEIMAISLSAVESLIHRAKTNLQKKLYYLYKNNML